MRTRWIAGRCNTITPEFRLFCFSHAGGGSSLYTQWRNAFGSHIEVCPIVLPGRERRIHEPLYRRMDEIIGPLMEALQPYLDIPFALFGHSLGSIMAFEVARQATSLGSEPKLLMVSGRRAPHLRTQRIPIYSLEEQGFLHAIGQLNGTPPKVLQDEFLMRSFLPSLRADFEINETYSPLTGHSLSCEIAAFMGVSDPEVQESELITWREVTSGPFSHCTLEGDHFYLQSNLNLLLDLVRQHLTPYVSKPTNFSLTQNGEGPHHRLLSS